MSVDQISVPSRRRELNVQISNTCVQTRSVSKLVSTTSKTSAGRSTSNILGSAFGEAFDRIQSRRQTIRFESNSLGYSKLRVNSSLQYFREDWGGITALRYLQDGERIAVGFNSGNLEICTAFTGSTVRCLVNNSETILKGWEGNDSISSIRFHPKQPAIMYAASTAGTVLRRDLDDSTNYNDYFITEEENEIYSIDFTASNCQLVTAGRDATIRVYDVEAEKQLCEYGYGRFSKTSWESRTSKDNVCHEKRIYCVRCHPEDPSTIVSGGWDGQVKVWDIRSRTPVVRNITGPFIFGDAIDICNGTLLTASCVACNSLEIWDLGSGFRINNIEPSNKRVYLYGEYPYAAQFFKGDLTGDLVLYGVGGVQIISIKESSILYLFEDEKPVVAIDSIGKKVGFGGKSNSVLSGKIFFPENERSVEESQSGSSFELSAYSTETTSRSIIL